MSKHLLRLVFIVLASFALFACSGEKELTLEVKAAMDGEPAPGASVMVDGAEVGTTGEDGRYAGTLRKKPGVEVRVSVIRNAPGYKFEPWEETFVMKVPPEGKVDTYPFEATLKATKFITVAVKEKGVPLEGATVKVGGKKAGDTDAAGQYVHEYRTQPKKGLKIRVSKRGYATWQRTRKVEPGQVLEVSLHREAVLTVKPLTEEYGRTKGMAGVPVSIGGKRAGKTNDKGTFTYVYRGEPGKKVSVSLSTPGFIPSTWKTRVKLEGRSTITRYFYPATPRPIRAGIYGYASNVPEEDITGMLNRIEEAVANNLFSYMIFQEVTSDTLRSKMKKTKVNIEQATTKGWDNTALMRTVDVVILGSISKNEAGYVVETKAFASDGRLVLSQINAARSEGDMKSVAKEAVSNFIRQFPFEGMVTASEGDRYRINLGSSDYRLRRGMEFALMAPTFGANGKVKKYSDVGTLKVKRTGSSESWGEAVELRKGGKVKPGFKVVRRIYTEEEKRAAKDSFVLLAKGGVPPDVDPLAGVNVYLDDKWVGTTGSKGKVKVPVKLGKTYDLVLYRHGYQQVSAKVSAEKDGELKEYALEVNNSLLKVESDPSGAKVFVDGKAAGRTPVRDGIRVNFGFHTLRLVAGGDFRDWEEVVEFNRKSVELTGGNRIVMAKDYLKLAEKAKAGGDIDAAISLYDRAGKDHPDYSDARYRLAQVYMDEKKDYASAAREFENVLSVPENEQLIFKQYAVTYTNLGHAYYEMGNALVREDRETAARHFASAIKNLDIAKQNARFLPTKHYDEAVHDTYYYSALSHHKLYLLTRNDALLDKADLAWREYFDFFPQKLEGDSEFTEIRESADKYWSQIKDIR